MNNIKQIFNTPFDFNDYLHYCGVEDINTYTSNQYVEDWHNYNNILKGAQMIFDAIMNNDYIYLIQDCDFDGIGSCILQYMFIKRIDPNAKVRVLIHNKYPKAHGLTDSELMDKLISYGNGIESITSEEGLLWIADAGTNDAKQCERLAKYGYKIVITDHHNKDEENPYATIINNHIGQVENTQLSGCGVTFKVCQAIDSLNRTKYANEFLSLVHFTNISDSCEFTNPEQNTFRYWGLRTIHPNWKPFVDAFNYKGGLSNGDFSFGIVSRINAVIRVGTLEQKQKLFLALAHGIDIDEAIKICKDCKTAQDKEITELLENDHITVELDNNIVVCKLDKETSLTGLVANKLMSKYNKPIFLVYENNEGNVLGSCRSPIELKMLCDESGVFNFARGHDHSFGVSWKKENEQEVYSWICSLTLSEPHIDVLQSYTTKSIPKKLFSEFGANKSLYGHGIEDPYIHIYNITFKGSDIKVMGKDKRTLKLQVDGIDFMWFTVSNATKEALGIGTNKEFKLELVGTMEINEWNGKITPQIKVADFETIPYDSSNLSLGDIF